MAYLQLPNGSYLEVPKGMQPIQALQEARSAFPRAFMSEEELSSKQGFGPAAGQAFGEFTARSAEGLGALFGSDTLKKYATDKQKELDESTSYMPTEEGDVEAARKRGLIPLAGAALSKYVTEPIGGIVGRYGLPMAAQALGPVGRVLGPIVDYPAEVGENLQRMRQQKTPEDVTSAALYGAGQAALLSMGIPGGGKIMQAAQKYLGPEIKTLSEGIVAGTIKKEEALARLNSTARNIAQRTAGAAVQGAGLMVGTEAMRRASAGQDVTGSEAQEAYKESLIGAAELAPLFGIPHGAFTRRGQVKQVEGAVRARKEIEAREERAREDAEAAAQADVLDAEKYNRAVQNTFGPAERPAEGVQGRTADMFGGTYAAPEGALPPQRALNDNLLPREREQIAQEQAVEAKSPQEVMNQKENLEKYVTGLRDQVSAAAAKADIKTLGELTPKLKEVEAAYAAAYKEYSALNIPEVKFKELTEQIETKTKQLQKAGGAQGDFAKIEKLTNDIQKLQGELEKVKPPSGPDLFAVEKEVVAKGKAEAAEALAQGQQDFLAQVGKPETRIDARQRQTLERYNDNVRQLDEAYAANADKRIIDKLVDSVQADATERAAIVAKTSDTRTLAQEEAGQQRIARITRAIAEAEAKGDTASVAGLRNQLAKAIVETARPDVSTRRNRALEDQQAAIEELRSQVEDLKTKRYLGEGARDMSTAASLKAGLERKANETIGRYVEAAIRDVNAVRDQNNVKKLTQTEAIRLAMDVRGHLENAVRNLNVTALRMPKESTVSTLEKQLAQIKRKHHKGESTSPKRAEEFALRPEFDTLRAQQEQGKKIESGTPFETEARKVEREELEAKAEKEKTKERAYADVGNPDQRNLFGEKDLEPIATTRATPENFMRLLRSGVVQELRSKLAEIETIAPKANKKEIAKAQQEKTARETFANEVAVEKATQAADKVRKAVANTEKYIQELNDKLSAVRMAVPTIKNPDAKPTPELVRQRKAVLKEREAIAKQFEKKGTTLNKQLVEQKERLRAAEAKVDALENGPQRVKRLTNEIKAEEDKTNSDAQRLAKLRDQLEIAENNTADKPFESFASQLKKQQRVVEEVAAAEELAGNLRHNAAQLWAMSGRAKIELEKAVTEQKEIAAKLKNVRETKRGLEKDNEANLRQAEGNPDFAEEFINKTKVEIAKVNKEIDGLKKKDETAQEKVRVAEESVRELREEAPKRMAELDSYNKRANELLESNLKTERAILASMERQYARMNKASPEARAFAKQMTELRKQTAVSAREFSLSREKRNKETRDLEEAQAESDKLFRVTRQEIVGSNRKTQNVRELKKKEALEVALGKERDKATPDDNKIIRLERQLAALETTQEVTRKQITREVPLATEAIKRETRLEEQVREREEAIARVESRKETGGVSRTKLADALKEESIVSAELKEIRRQLGNFTNVIVGLEKSAKATTKPEAIAAFEKRLKDARKNLEAKGLVEKEKALVDKLTELKKVGVGVERALEVIGPKAGRENRTSVKGPPLTPEQTAARKAAAKQRKLLNEDFEHYLKTEDRAKREIVGPRAEYKGPSGTDYRISPATEQRLEAGESKRVSGTIEKNLPKDVKVKSVDSFAELPKEVKAIIARDGIVEGAERAETVRGFVTPNGEVYIIRGNHATVKDLERTYAHEIIGHAGVDRILGKEGMEKLSDRIRTQDGGAYELASKLGADVRKNFDGSMADYALSIEAMRRRGEPQAKIDAAIKEMDIKATQELIAYTAELRVDENLRTKAGRWMKEIVGMVRQWLRDHGFAELSKVSTSDIYNILRQSQRNFNRGELGAFREVSGQVSFRTQKAKFNDSFDSELSKSIQQTVPSQKPWLDRIFGNAMGMTMMHRFEDNFAGLAHMATVNKRLTGSIEGTQMMYFNRLSHNISNMVGEWVTHGPVGIAMTRGKKGEPTAEYQYVNKTEKYKLELAEERANKTPDQAKIVDLEQKIKTGVNGLAPAYEAIGKAAPEIGNTEAAFQAFTYYMAGERVTGLAQREGISFKEALKKLDLGEKLSEADVQRGLQFGRNNKHFQEARKLNKIYNDAQIDFLVETGYLTPAKAAELKKGDFVPFYRERNGEIVDNEYNIRVGDLTTQKHLKELIGGDQPILPFHISSLQNTRMLAEMGMKNIATKNTAYTLNNWGIAEVRPGDGPAAANVIRFYDKGEKKHAILNFKDAYVGMEKKLEEMKKDGKANTPEYKKLREKAEASRENSELFGNIPAELVVRGMEGIALTLPAAVSWLRGPADLLRKGVTRNPLYAVRSLYKESLSSWITTGADVTPLLSSLKAAKQVLGKETPTTLKELRAAGITGGHVYSGTMSDLNTIALQIASGKSGWEKTWAGLDRLAIRADEAGRVALYDGFVRKGMSQMEAQLATLESQNFTKRGYSPTMSMLSVMIPFFNSQVSGLSTFVRNMSGKSIFEDKLNLQRTAMMRGAVMAGSTLLYTSLMQNNKAYKNATDEQKLNNWFVPIPFFEEPLRVAIPFEAGTVFKAVPEALYNLMATDAKAKFVLPALRDQILQSVPGYSSKFVPQGVKPILEAYTNKDFFSGQDIESKRQLDELPGYRENANTTEAAKTFGKLIGISPIQLDHALNSYTGGAGIAILSMLNPVLRSSTPPDLKPSQYAVFGSSFQPVDGAGIINKAFKEAEEIEQINKTYKNLEEKNPSEAIAFANKNIRAVDFGSEAGRFKRQMGEYAKEEREIRALPRAAMSSAEKTRLIDKIKQEKIDYAKEFRASVNG